ncbi:unnamed protein product, partial [Ectocarpus fasciculatus]
PHAHQSVAEHAPRVNKRTSAGVVRRLRPRGFQPRLDEPQERVHRLDPFPRWRGHQVHRLLFVLASGGGRATTSAALALAFTPLAQGSSGDPVRVERVGDLVVDVAQRPRRGDGVLEQEVLQQRRLVGPGELEPPAARERHHAPLSRVHPAPPQAEGEPVQREHERGP